MEPVATVAATDRPLAMERDDRRAMMAREVVSLEL